MGFLIGFMSGGILGVLIMGLLIAGGDDE